jgi:hypothetical protein
MPKQVLFIQGGGEGAHAIDADLAASLARLLGGEFEVRYPFMPNEAAPAYLNRLRDARGPWSAYAADPCDLSVSRDER